MKNIIYIFALSIVSITMIPAQVEDDTIEVVPGWNMIGAISTKTLNEIRSEPPGIITSSYYGYSSGGYSTKDTLRKGKGYWVKASQAGFILSVNLHPAIPSNPIPYDNDTGVSNSPTLSWTSSDPENDALTYDVWFGTDNPPATKVSSGQSDTSLNRSGLNNNTTYYWKVVAKDSHGDSTIGVVWTFTTLSGSGSACPGIPTVTYLGKTYNTVLIGSQCWFKENLDVGTMISGSTNQTNNSIIEKYCYNNDTAKCSIYGGLYQWNEAMQYSATAGSQGICPSGWHIPTYAEHFALSMEAGNGNALIAVGQGTGGGAGTNTSGFSALISGYRFLGGYFDQLGLFTYFWSSTEDDTTLASNLRLTGFNGEVLYAYSHNKEFGCSVRCLKD